MKIIHKLYLLPTIFILLFLVAIIVHLQASKALEMAHADLAFAESLDNNLREISMLNSEHILHHQERAHQQIFNIIGETQKLLQHHISFLPSPDHNETYQNIQVSISTILQNFQEIIHIGEQRASLTPQGSMDKDAIQFQILMNRMTLHLLMECRDIAFEGKKIAGQALTTMAWAEAKAKRSQFVLMSLFLLFVMGMTFWIRKSVRGPLHALLKGTRKIGSGDLDYQIPRAGNDEFGQLAQSFNSMAVSLKKVTSSRDELEQEIAGRKKAENEAHQAREDWDRTFDTFEDIITQQNTDMNIVRINAAGIQAFQLDQENIVGMKCYQLFRGIGHPCPGCPIAQALEDFTPHSAEIHHESLNKTFAVSACPTYNQEGKVIGVIHLARDTTQQRDLEKQLRQAQKLEAIGTLAGGIAHDFNNILSAIIGFSQLLEKQLPPEGQEHEDIGHVLDAAGRATDLVRQILNFSRSGEHSFHPLLLAPVVKEALKLLRSSIPTTIAIEEDIDPDCQKVLADATQIHSVVMNLCTNAYHAMRETGGKLAVSLRQKMMTEESIEGWSNLLPGAFLVLEVSDTGTCIAKSTLDHIFDPYFTTKKKGEGTGLGLSVVHSIVHSHGGQITVYSEEGVGTTFRVYLPLCADGEERETAPVETRALIGGKEHLLVVDDELPLVTYLKRALEPLGYQVTTFTSSQEALAALQKEPDTFDLILTDMNMPEMNGTEFMELALLTRKDIPVILCTGFSEMITDRKALSAGASAFLTKPYSIVQLARVVRESLDKTNAC